MLLKTTVIKETKLSATLKTTVKIDEKIEFTIVPSINSDGVYYLYVEDIKGDLEITKIKRYDGYGFYEVSYNNVTKKFKYYRDNYYTFTVVANIDNKVVSAAIYHLQIPSARTEVLKLYECFESKIILPEYENFVFPFYVKRVMPNGNTDAIELHIVNPYNARIQGQTGDYRQSFKNINLQLSFVIEPNALDNSEKDDVNSSLYSDKKFLQEEIFTSTDTVTDSTETGMSKKESEPSPKKESSSIQPAVKWYEIMSNNEYSDVTFISSDLNEIQSHRCLLSKYSKIFAQIIKEASELPVKINIEKFKAETIHAALDFLYDKIDAIDGKEMDVFTFALEYGIHQITDACCFFFEKSVDPTNVCEYIQIAYNQNFEELKKKCLKVLVEKKKEIDASKFAKLPENILSDFFTAL